MNFKAKEVLSTSVYLLCVVLLALFIVKYIGQRNVVIGSSMSETLMDGDNLILDKISYRFHDPERFDVVVFPSRDIKGKNFIKRIIALPGETIYIDKEGTIYINGEVLEEHYGNAVIEDAGRAAQPVELGDDEYFVMGDNRNNSDDSRFNEIGIVKRSEIAGKTKIRIYPFSGFGNFEKQAGHE